ncbi:MAG TPA: tryptophan synthase subunit alpha [Bacteroidota bacterium]|nr:tryptophan synthase subunit alpha [Bacteroidota bacterium]
MNSLTELLTSRRAERRKALALFLTAGYPARDSTPGLVLPLADSGADIIEIGMPFSDPLADGPVIQKSSAAAIANGVTIPSILDDVRTIRKSSPVPIVLMGYVNPILSYGADRFFSDASDSGVDGVILPELTLEESGRFRNAVASRGLAQILLVAPTTPADRVRAIDEASSGFLYCVSTTGVTGSSPRGSPVEFLARVRSHAVRNPLLIGFGIASAEDARHAASLGDGVIIGSALIRRIDGGGDAASLSAWVRSIRSALDAR